MAKTTKQHARGRINGRYFIALTEKVGAVTTFIALEKQGSHWDRHIVSRDRLAKLYKALTASA